MKTLRLLAFVVACSLLVTVRASATPMSNDVPFINTVTFTIFDLVGPLAGNTYSGSFSWSPYDTTKLTAFSTDFPSWVDAVTNHGATLADLSRDYPDQGELSLLYAPPPDGNPDAFYFLGNTHGSISYVFYYGPTGGTAVGWAEVSYGPTVLTGTPEPGTLILLATGFAGTMGMVRRRFGA